VCAKGERGVEVEVLKESVFENHREIKFYPKPKPTKSANKFKCSFNNYYSTHGIEIERF